ncbi:MAG: FHA domain-containing protein [Gammaproteobacteria bacterium]|nr:FHA domain-containing protein [Gammaproteobacteria bacterium]MCP5406992.1 FHA domain-containing protein [Chromatiaceae bacterium]MCP5445162.1 FHA domain-containing protein [Chromatiaceae bacterium]
MFKLVIMRGGLETGQVVLEAKRISIGRDQTSDITLDDASVSRHHARLIRVMDSYYLEDLDSTNGTQRNHRPITKHVLKHSDEIRIGGFTLYFIAEEEAGQRESDASPEPPTAAASATEIKSRPAAAAGTGSLQLPKTARLRFFRGPNTGRTEILGRGLYTIGKPGGEVAVIARRPQGFFLLHIGGERYPRINNHEVNSVAGVKLNEADVVEVGENLAEITFS